MNDFQGCLRECQVGVKAAQNIAASLSIFERLCNEMGSKDDVSLFYAGVIRYAKPFCRSETERGSLVYPVKAIKKRAGFSGETHEHLLKLRHTLIAHDDFTYIEPRLLLLNISPRGSGYQIPMSITISNKALSHPSSLAVTQDFRTHIKAAFDAVSHRLAVSMKRLRQIALEYPELTDKPSYSKHLGSTDIAAEGTRIGYPNYHADSWLSIEEPHFSEVQNG